MIACSRFIFFATGKSSTLLSRTLHPRHHPTVLAEHPKLTFCSPPQLRRPHSLAGLHRDLLARSRSHDRSLARRTQDRRPTGARHALEPDDPHDHRSSPSRNREPHSCRRRTQIFPSWEPGFRGIDAFLGPVPGPLLMQTELTGLVSLCKLEVRRLPLSSGVAR